MIDQASHERLTSALDQNVSEHSVKSIVDSTLLNNSGSTGERGGEFVIGTSGSTKIESSRDLEFHLKLFGVELVRNPSYFLGVL